MTSVLERNMGLSIALPYNICCPIVQNHIALAKINVFAAGIGKAKKKE